jgi:hypothetical protein
LIKNGLFGRDEILESNVLDNLLMINEYFMGEGVGISEGIAA